MPYFEVTFTGKFEAKDRNEAEAGLQLQLKEILPSYIKVKSIDEIKQF